MSQYRIYQAIPMSFYSKSLYRDVAWNWGGKVFLYLFFILLLSWLILVFQIQAVLGDWYKKHGDALIQQMPVVTIKDGKIITPEKRPYIIKYPESGETIAVIDTSGTYTPQESATLPILITETTIVTHPQATQTRIDQVPANLNMVIVPSAIQKYIGTYINYLWVFFLVAFLFASYIYRIIQAFLYGILGKIFAAIVGAPVSYWQAVKISMVAVTPGLVIATIFDFFAVGFQHILIFYFLISAIYIFYGIMANRTQAVITAPPEK